MGWREKRLNLSQIKNKLVRATKLLKMNNTVSL